MRHDQFMKSGYLVVMKQPMNNSDNENFPSYPARGDFMSFLSCIFKFFNKMIVASLF